MNKTDRRSVPKTHASTPEEGLQQVWRLSLKGAKQAGLPQRPPAHLVGLSGRNRKVTRIRSMRYLEERMPSPHVARFLTVAASAAFLAGCGSLHQLGPPGATEAPAARVNAHSGTSSWMAHGLTNQDLLYVGNGNGTVSVYNYADGTIAGVLTAFARPQGMCSDRSGNVYITDYQVKRVYEYAHGGSKPIFVLHEHPYHPYACSVDPKTGDIAIADYTQTYDTPGSIRVYSPKTKKTVTYTATRDDHFIGCAYDAHGDLFAVSDNWYYGYSYGSYFNFYYLPKAATQLIALNVPNPHYSSGWDYQDVQDVAWDGRHWIVESYEYLDRYDINVDVTYVGDTLLTASYRYQGPIALYQPTRKGKASQVVAASSSFSGKSAVDYWAYPAGGSPTATITQDLDNPFGVAISLGASSR